MTTLSFIKIKKYLLCCVLDKYKLIEVVRYSLSQIKTNYTKG